MSNTLLLKYVPPLLFVFAISTLSGQVQYDYQWLMGIGPNEPLSQEGGVLIDFHQGFNASYRNLPSMGRSNAFTNICDFEGNLMFYTNNCGILNFQDEIVEEGFGLNAPGADFDAYCGVFPAGGGYNTRSSFILPIPGSNSKYVIFHLRYDFPTTPEYFYHVESFLYTIVDMNALNGHGSVIEKNILIVKDTLCDMLTAVRHGNGRDWWVICPQFNSNQVFLCLLTPDGVEGPYTRTTPLFWPGELDDFWWEQAVFSPDGRSYARINNQNGIQVFNFDRCSGEFNNPLQLYLPVEDASTSGVAISPNSQFLYADNGYKVYQFDLEADNVQNSRILIAEYDGHMAPLWTTFNMMQLAPDNKIYINSTNSVYKLHVIHNPNENGVNCNLEQHGVELPVKVGLCMPNFPYFPLFSDVDSPCDTLNPSSLSNITLSKTDIFYLAPNPASQFVSIHSTTEISDFDLEWYNNIGQLVLTVNLANDKESIDTSMLPKGSYIVVMKKNNIVYSNARCIISY